MATGMTKSLLLRKFCRKLSSGNDAGVPVPDVCLDGVNPRLNTSLVVALLELGMTSYPVCDRHGRR